MLFQDTFVFYTNRRNNLIPPVFLQQNENLSSLTVRAEESSTELNYYQLY